MPYISQPYIKNDITAVHWRSITSGRMAQRIIGIDYILVGDYYIPDIELPEDDDRPIGKWGRMHRVYLEETNPLLLNHLILTGKRYPYLLEIEDAAHSLIDNCKARAEEIILTELIYI